MQYVPTLLRTEMYAHLMSYTDKYDDEVAFQSTELASANILVHTVSHTFSNSLIVVTPQRCHLEEVLSRAHLNIKTYLNLTSTSLSEHQDVSEPHKLI